MLVFVRYPLTERRDESMIAETDARKRVLLGTAPIAPVPVPVAV